MITFSTLRVVLIPIILFLGTFGLAVPPAEAQRDNDRGWRYNSGTSRAIENLDDDIVEKFPIPVLFGLSLVNIRPDFGDDRDGGDRSHEGQDMMAPKGTPIVSPTEAVVTSVGNGESAGKYVYTANPGGESWRYMHLDDVADIKVGDELEAGDFIGTVGNTGNASGGAPHLHFEIKKGDARDPHPRLDEAYDLKEKMELVVRLFKDIDDKDEMAEFMVETFLSDFKTAVASGYDMPREIKEALEDKGVVDTSDLQKKLNEIIASIPTLVPATLTLGDTGVGVSLLQIFLIFENTGPLSVQLARSGATGYFGPVTSSAIREYQTNQDITVTGVYDAQTREEMMDN